MFGKVTMGRKIDEVVASDIQQMDESQLTIKRLCQDIHSRLAGSIRTPGPDG